ncbi:MAG: glycine oxidase ThiO [Thermoanaerobaculia bacterium]|nr:glycine oxidase ThiO [Thermoanaerobaculia bacterium]
MTISADVVVLGGGLVGLACARALARAGVSVALLERGSPGAGASSAAAGMLAPLGDAPGPLGPIARAARDDWELWRRAIEEESGRKIEAGADGALVVALDDDDQRGLQEIAAQAAEIGEKVEDASLAEIRRRVPDLSPAVHRVLHLPGERRVDNVAAVAALTIAAQHAGVRLEVGFDVTKIELPANRIRVHARDGRIATAGHLVLAAGASSSLPSSSSSSGLLLPPISPVRGQMLRLTGVRWAWDGIVRRPSLYSVRRGESDLLIGATVEPNAGFAVETTVGGLATLLDWTRRTFPTLGDRVVTASWAGLRPATADGLPLVGPLPGDPRVIAATGHYRNGVLLAPWTADVVAETVLHGCLPERARALDPARFAGP